MDIHTDYFHQSPPELASLPFQAGQLPHFIHHWTSISHDPTVLDFVRGYKIKFSSPPPLRIPSIKELSLLSSSAVIDEEVMKMLAIGAVEEVPPSPGFYSKIFAVPKVERGQVYGQRVILNLKVTYLTFIIVLLSYATFKIAKFLWSAYLFNYTICQMISLCYICLYLPIYIGDLGYCPTYYFVKYLLLHNCHNQFCRVIISLLCVKSSFHIPERFSTCLHTKCFSHWYYSDK